MRRFVIPFSHLFLCGAFALLIPLAGCKSKSDAPTPPTPPSAKSGAKPNVAPSLPPEVQVGPPK